MPSASVFASVTSVTLSVPSSTGTSAALASVRALVLSPRLFSTSTVGPTNRMPAASSCSAKLAFSLRNPYPGCTASTPSFTQRATRFGTSRYAASGSPAVPTW